MAGDDMIWLPVAPSFRGFGAQMVKEATGAARQAGGQMNAELAKSGKQAGQSAGKGVADGVRASAQQIEKASTAVAQARKKESDAAANVLQAEARLEESRRKGAGSEQIARQEATLEQHRRRQESAARQLSAAEQDVQSIRDGGTGRAQAVVRAENQVEKARLDSAKAADDVALAEAKVTELHYKGEQSASKVAKAQADLVKARSAQESAVDTLRAKEGLYAATLEDVEQQAQDTGEAIEDAGKKADRSGGLMSKAAKGAKNLALGLGAAAATGIGVALTKGLSRINQLDQAQAKLTGLGHTAQSVEQIMTSASDAVTGTAYGLGDAATVAAATVAAGVKPGQDLTRTLKLVGDAATIAGTDMSSMGSIFNKVAATGKLQGDVLNQLGESGIPILDLLAQEMGVAQSEVAKLASEGKVDFQTFQNAMEAGMGGAALKSGNTLKGSLDNLMSAVGRLGEAALMPFIQDGKDLIGMLTEWVNSLKNEVGPAVEGFAGWLVNSLIPALRDTVRWVIDNKDILTTLVVSVVAGVAAFKAYQQTLIAVTAAKKLYAAATLIADKGMKGLNATMRANLIGIIVTAIIALVAGLVWFFTQTETGKAIWESFTSALATGWEWVKEAFASAWAVIQPILNGLWQVIKVVGAVWATVILGAIIIYWNILSTALQAAWSGIIKPVFDAFAFVIQWLWTAVLQPAWAGMQIAFQALGAFFQMIWNAVIKPMWTAFGAGVQMVWNSVIRPAWDAMKVALGAVGAFFQTTWNNVIKPVWNALGTGIRTVIDSVIKPAFDGVKSALQSVGDFFRTVVDGIRSVWDAMKGHVARPINFVIDTVWNNGLVEAWNTIAGFLPGLPDAKRLRPVAFAEGGPVPMMPGATRGKDSVHALMMPNEHVLDVDNVRNAGGHGEVYKMRGMIDAGIPFTWVDGRVVPAGHGLEPQRFAEGGAVGARLDPSPGEGGLKPIAILAKRLIHRIWPSIDTIGGYRQDAYPEHPSGRALDVMVGVGNPIGDEVTSWALANDHILPLIHALWKQTVWMPGGATQPMGDRGSPTQNHMDHPHLWYHPKDVDPNVVPDGLVGHDGLTRGDRLGVIKEKISEILDKALDPIREGMSRVLGDPPPELLGIPPIALDRTKEAAVDGAFSFAENIAGDLKEVYNQAKDVVTSITGLFRDEGGYIPAGKSIVNNETGKPEAVFNWRQVEQIGQILASVRDLDHLWAVLGELGNLAASGDYTDRLREATGLQEDDELVNAILSMRERFNTGIEDLQASMSQVVQAAGVKAANSYRDEALDFFGFKGLFDGVSELMAPPAQQTATTTSTATATTSGVTSGITGTVSGADTGLVYGDPNLTYETRQVALETKMPDFDRETPPGSGAERWRPMMIDALKNQGMDDWAGNPEIVDRFIRQIHTESKGDPNIAQQIVDVNGTGEAAGVGLGQAIPGTWAAYRDPSLPDDRRNGWAMLNFMARYVRQKYGEQGYTRIGNGIGYDLGGIADGIGFMPKYTLQPERVLSPAQTAAFEGWMSSGAAAAGIDASHWQAIDDLLVSLPSAAQFERIASLADADTGEVPAPRAAGPLLHIENLVARDEDEAMRAAAREARRLTRSSALVGGWRA